MTEIFVFGSNLAGRHGAGAAKHALEHHGAKYGCGAGIQGNSYAIPTKGHRLEVLPLAQIKPYVERFLKTARAWPELKFKLTAIGCGLAGYRPDEIAPMFRDAPANVELPEEFLRVIYRKFYLVHAHLINGAKMRLQRFQEYFNIHTLEPFPSSPGDSAAAESGTCWVVTFKVDWSGKNDIAPVEGTCGTDGIRAWYARWGAEPDYRWNVPELDT